MPVLKKLDSSPVGWEDLVKGIPRMEMREKMSIGEWEAATA